MEVFAVTVFVSLAFAVLFAVLFFAERSQRNGRSLEQTSLLPLDDGLGGAKAGKGENAVTAQSELIPVHVSSTSPRQLLP